jgi:hypothetical protein
MTLKLVEIAKREGVCLNADLSRNSTKRWWSKNHTAHKKLSTIRNEQLVW